MNRQIFLFICVILLAAGCKKPGADYTDGYDKSQDNPNATGAGSDALKNDFSKKEAAKFFPGLVSDNEARVSNYQVSIDLSKKYVPGSDIKSFLTPELLFSTGLYAPAGEVVTVTVPAGINGLSARIGGWTDILSGDLIKRDQKISIDIPLNPGINYLRNLYGGTIYVNNYSRIRTFGTVQFTFNGAVKSPDFVLGLTTDAQWNTAVRQSTVPWIQLAGQRIVLEMPKSFIDRFPIASPTDLMNEWDRIIGTDVYAMKGLVDGATDSLNRTPEVPLRIIMDAQLSASKYARYGYPVVVTMDENMYQSLANLDYIKKYGSWRAMHEVGFSNSGYWGNNTASWIWTWAQQPTADIFSAKMANRLNLDLSLMNDSLRRAVDSGLIYVSRNLALYSSNRSVNANFPLDVLKFPNADLVKLVPFIQLFEKYGYDLYTKVDYDARHLAAPLGNDQQKIDFFYRTISKARSIDFIPFFEMWGIRISPSVAAEIKALYPRLSSPIYSYNPITKAALSGTVPPPNKDINRLSWRLQFACCQEMDAGYHIGDHSFDYNDTTYWRSQWSSIIGTPSHSPHTIIVDMNTIVNVGSFWYINPPVRDSVAVVQANGTIRKFTPDGKFTPKTIRVYLAPNPTTGGDYVWSLAGTITAVNNNQVFNTVTFASQYTGMRYIKLEIVDSYLADPLSLNSVILGEFGVWTP